MLIRSISNTPTLHLYLMPHEFESKKEESGQINIAEAEMIVGKILAQLEEDKKNGLDILEKSKTIGIITPYAAQEKVLLRALKKANLQGIAAGTVNKFQGSERKTIFFSSTIGINDTNAGSLNFNKNDISIINVAVSRAKEKFILVGNTQNLTSSTSSYTGLLVEHMNKYK